MLYNISQEKIVLKNKYNTERNYLLNKQREIIRQRRSITSKKYLESSELQKLKEEKNNLWKEFQDKTSQLYKLYEEERKK